MRRVDTDDGIIQRTQEAVSWSFATDVDTWVWEVVGDYDLDAQQRLAATVDPLGRRTEQERDPVTGAILSTSLFAAGSEVPYSVRSATYNDRMQPLEQVDELGRRTVMTYDTDGNRLTRTDAAGTPDEATTTWTYNDRGLAL